MVNLKITLHNKWKIINDKRYKYLSKSRKKTCTILKIKMTSGFSRPQILRFISFNCRHDSNNKYLKSQYRNHFQTELFSLCGNSEKLKRWVYYIRIDWTGCWVTSINCLRNKPAHFSCNLIFYYGHYHPDVFWSATGNKDIDLSGFSNMGSTNLYACIVHFISWLIAMPVTSKPNIQIDMANKITRWKSKTKTIW